jgi:hypothetical protein
MLTATLLPGANTSSLEKGEYLTVPPSFLSWVFFVKIEKIPLF